MEDARRRAKNIKTVADIEALLVHSNPVEWFQPGKSVTVSDKMQTRYTYQLTARAGKDFAADFKPALTPARMLRLGVFEGKYLNDCVLELPREWYEDAIKFNKLCPEGANSEINSFRIKSRLPLAKWRSNGWIPIAPGDRDVRGWFQWYCRYWLGRRDENVDAIQIKRWKAFTRHRGQILAAYRRLGANRPKTVAEKRAHRPKQRQALLQWAYNPFV